MDDLFLFEHKQQLLQKNRERFNQRRNGRKSVSTSSPPSSQNSDDSEELRKNSNKIVIPLNKKKAARSDSEDEDGRVKRSKLNHDRAEEQLKCSPNVTNQKRPPQNAVDEEKLAKLRACFSSDSDSDDDDPVAAIKKRQIAARNRKKGWTLPEKGADDFKAARSPEKGVTAAEQSPASFKQPSEESSLPPNPTLKTKMPSLNNTASKGGHVNMDIDTKIIMEDAIPPPKTSSTEPKKETPIMKRTATTKADIDNKGIDDETMIDYSAAKTASPSAKKTSTMMKVDADEENEPIMSLTIVSWNISSAESSSVAPDLALRTHEAPRLIREEILRSQPDVIALQETAYPSFGAEKFASFGYVSIGSQTALHTDEYVDLLVKRELALGAKRTSLQSFQMKDLPAVAVILTLPNRTRIAITSIHLPHTKEAAPFRKMLCGAIMEQLASQNCDGIILTGDFNMRDFEDKTTEKLCGGNWVDAWKMVTKSDKETKFTWNSRVNMYHGPENFSWTCRLDRCYVKSEKVTLKHFGLIGNQPVDGKEGDYLSDHYGIVVKCDVASSDSTLDNDALSSVGSLLPVSTTSKSAANSNSSLRDGTNAAALRAARLQRFEKAANSGTSQHTKKGNQEIIDLLGDSDDEDDKQFSNSLESDRALAERLQREEEMSAHRAFAKNSIAQVDYSNMRPGVFGTMRNKRAYLQDGDQIQPERGMLEQLLVAQGISGLPFVQDGVTRFKDSHPQAWSSGGWVWVKNPQYAKDPKARVDTEDNVARMSTEWKSLVESNVKITHQHLIDLAEKHNVLHGKWLLYVKAEDIETDWPKIRNAIIEGKLGSTAKISDTPERGSHVVCIYCPNFLDKDELLRVRRSISNEVGMYKTSVLRFKMDAVTYLNLYAGNKWKVKTCSYECGGKKDEECSTLISHWEKCTCATSNKCKRCYKKPKEDNDKEDVFCITGLKHADAQGEKVTLLREPENVSVQQVFNICIPPVNLLCC